MLSLHCKKVRLIIFLIAHMWFDNTIIEADTTEDQSGVAHDKVVVYFQLRAKFELMF